MITTAITPITLAAALLAANPPAPALVAGAPESPRKVHVEVDATELGPDGDGMDGLIMENLVPKLQEAGFEIVAERDEAIDLRVRFEALRLEKFDYGIHFEFVDGDQADAAMRWVACLGCMDAKLLPLLEENAPELIEALEKRAKAATQEAPPDDSPGVVDDTPQPPPVKPIGPLGYAGIGVTVLGLGATIGGAIELVRGRVYDSPQDVYVLTGTDHRPLGYALLGAGAAVTVAGVVMLGVDVGRRAKQRKQAGSQQALIIPSLSPSSVGVGIVGRF